MEALEACEAYKAKARACYGSWFDGLLKGNFVQSDCDQETDDYKQCILENMEKMKKDAAAKAKTQSDGKPSA
ncbi:hypothetical protein SPRG_11617 [Saprolegnia parasitica CBS 223.65]|uniref:IMS import disulfide relay-system CHCH-CHCH-like Cx9C domain-containing protein n=1 Tax=Saprolegnia parasitica (strain CBS 223.65) TaxID=695850 RepID=A0A067BYG6_SAPPC|nr:hypothetical protein SPRG_11617 [Saprolegnia parasitica CBS 223.65]KDO23303.1 hypothetical protein SPRG_11617 [Saprolegnia parasitica CBS 223.65]|eukprot:XP_012205955.1 hypothetical protein SPRG_11617 [Saprolegnia parasitica CBS 223.65]